MAPCYLAYASTKHYQRNKTERFNTNLLINDKDKRKEYQQKIDQNIEDSNDKTWKNITTIIKQVAKETIGVEKRRFKRKQIFNEEIEQLSKEQKEIRLQINNTKDTRKVKQIRNQRNQILHNIKKVQEKVTGKEIDNVTNDIAESKHDLQFFKALKMLRNPKKTTINIVHDKNGKIVANPDEKYKIVKDHFQNTLITQKKRK